LNYGIQWYPKLAIDQWTVSFG